MSTMYSVSQTQLIKQSKEISANDFRDSQPLGAGDMRANCLRRRIALSSLAAYVTNDGNPPTLNNLIEEMEGKR